MHIRNRLEYESFMPSDGSESPPTKLKLVEHRAMTRAYHLCALAFMLGSFQPETPIGTGWEDSMPLRSYGLLIESISEGLFRDIDEIAELAFEAGKSGGAK